MTNTREQGTGNREQELREKVIKGLKHEIARTELEWIDCVEVALLRDALGLLSAEGLWAYCPDDEGRPRWKCSRCGKIVHKDPAEKLYCAACGQRNRKEA